MKNQKFAFVGLALLVLLVSGCTQEPLVGGDKDEHGCVATAGYTWCESKQECLRTWEEECHESAPVELEGGLTEELCIEQGGRAVDLSGDEICSETEKGLGIISGTQIACCVLAGFEKLTPQEAIDIAQNSDCTADGNLVGEPVFNGFSRTWWIDIDIEKSMCDPACVVYEETKTVEINLRCTGVLPPK